MRGAIKYQKIQDFQNEEHNDFTSGALINFYRGYNISVTDEI